MYKIKSSKLGVVYDHLSFEEIIEAYQELKNSVGAAKLSHEYGFLEKRFCKIHGKYEQNIKNKIFHKLYPSSGSYIIYDPHLKC